MSNDQVIGRLSLAVTAMLFAVGLRQVWQFIHYSTFQNVIGTITSSSVEASVGAGGVTAYVLKVQYEYAVDGEVFLGVRLHSLGTLSFRNPDAIKALQRNTNLENGGSVKVFFDPNKPNTSFLINGPCLMIIIPLIGSLFFLGMGLFLAW
jgi:hypothetical protein